MLTQEEETFSPQPGESFHLMIDQSGSMSSAVQTHFDGARELIGELPESVSVTFSTFNRSVDVGERLTRDETLSRLEERVCDGPTSLYDAICAAIEHEETAPMQKTTIVVITDGVDTSSTRDIHETRACIERVNRRQGWSIIFLGTGQDAILSANTIGIPVDRALTFENNRALHAYRAVSQASHTSRSGTADIQFTDLQRQQSMQGHEEHAGGHPPPIRRQATSNSTTF